MDFIDHRSTANFIFSLSATDEKFRIKSDGNVGIGVSNPSTKLEVDGVITTAGLTTTADINFGDNDKAIFGAGSDLQIYHDGSNSFIDDQGTGSLVLQSNGAFTVIQNSSGVANARFDSAGAASLRYNGSEKLATTSTGIDVTGSVISDGLTVDGNPVINGTSPQLFLQTGASNYNWQIAAQENVSDAFEISSGSADANATNDTYTKRLVIQQSGDISFYEDTGTTAKFFWDASAESLGIGIAPSKKLSVFGTGAGNATVQIEGEGGADPYINFLANNTQHWSLGIDDSDADKFKLSEHSALGTNDYLVVDVSGNVGIGTSSPSSSLTTETDSGVLVTDASGLRQIEIVPPQTSNSFVGEMGTRSSHPLVFNTVNTERMRIDSSGDMIMKGGRIKVRENDDGNDAVVITRDADEGYVNLYSSGSQTVEIRGNGNSYFNGGNVGIGTDSPRSLINASSATGAILTLESSDTTLGENDVVGQIDFYANDASTNSTGNKAFIKAYSETAGGNKVGLDFATSSSTSATGVVAMTINSDGDVGIGTSPSYRLHVVPADNDGIIIDSSSDSHTGFLYFGDATSNTVGAISYDHFSDAMRFKVNGGERMRIDSSGNVAINRSSAAATLDVNLGTTGDIAIFRGGDSDTFTIDSDGSGINLDTRNTTDGLTFQMQGVDKMTLDASGNLLVGKTTTSNATAGAELNASGQIVGTFASGTHILGRNTNDGSILEFQKDGTTVGSIGTELSRLFIGSDDSMIFFDAGSTNAIWPWTSTATSSGDADNTIDIGDSSNRFKNLYLSGTAYTNALGVGTTSPDVKVDIVDTAADVQLRVYKFDGTNNTRLSFTADDSGAKIHYRDATNGGALRFNNNAGEMARFDASGNLLVGTTSASGASAPDNSGTASDAGIRLSPTGFIGLGANQAPSGYFNRIGNDGDIIKFNKDGTAVGSIGTKLSDGGTSDGELFITSGNTGLFFDDIGSYIRPCNGSAALRDNTVDLGKSDSRFKDLYLSGGAYLGGTGSANHLDDYEEGTFSPTLYGASSAGTTTYATVTGTYTKVGNRCTINFVCSVTATTGTGSLRLGGLPFSSSGENTTALMINNLNWGGGTYLMAYVGDNDTFARVYYIGDDNTWQQQQITNEAQHFIFTLTYQTA